MFIWLNAKSAVEYGKLIVEKVVAATPLEAKPGKAAASSKRTANFEKLLAQISSGESRRFNFYQKAKFGNTLKWGLRERGYPRDFVDEVVHLILTRIS